jgi:hypothetical protein
MPANTRGLRADYQWQGPLGWQHINALREPSFDRFRHRHESVCGRVDCELDRRGRSIPWRLRNLGSYSVPCGVTPIRLCGFAVASMVVLGNCRQALAADNTSPRLFAPGILSGPADDLSPAFSPDGQVVYFTRGNDSASTILTKRSTPRLHPTKAFWCSRRVIRAAEIKND